MNCVRRWTATRAIRRPEAPGRTAVTRMEGRKFKLSITEGLPLDALLAQLIHMFCPRPVLACLFLALIASAQIGRAQTTTQIPGGLGFRFTYPVREEGSAEVFTAPQPPPPEPPAPASSDAAATVSPPVNLPPPATVPEPPPLDEPAPAPRPATDLEPVFASPTEDGEVAFEQVGDEGTLPADIGEGRFGRRPYRFSFAVYEGYNSNVNTSGTDPVESPYTQISAGVSYEFGSPRLQLSTALSAGLAFYYNNNDLTDNGLFPTINFALGANYAATPRLDLSFNTATSFLSQPNYTISGAPTTYDGDYLLSISTFGAKYLWLPKFATETSYSPVFYYFTDPDQNDIQGRYEQTVSQQFMFLWKPTTALVLEYDFNMRNYYTAKDLDSIGNFLLAGFDHTLNPRSTVTMRAGVEQRFNENPYGGSNTYVGPFGSVNFNYALGKETTVGLVSRYGTTASGFSNYNQAQQFLLGLNAAHQFTRRLGATAFFNYQNNFYDQPGSDGAAPDFYDNIFNTGFNASFLVYRNWSLLAGYAFTTLISTDTNFERDYTQNIVFLGAEVDF